MNDPNRRFAQNTQDDIPQSTAPPHGMHCSHFYYTWDRHALSEMSAIASEQAAEEFSELFGPKNYSEQMEWEPDSDWPARTQLSLVVGDKADFGVMAMDTDPLKVERLNQAILSSELGLCLQPAYSFVSLSEISEYVPTVEQFTEKMRGEGGDPQSPSFQSRAQAYADRLPAMNKNRLSPVFPDWPVTCFYPMNKRRDPGANWFDLPFSQRNEMMSEHARSGIQFMGKVTQLITVGVGLEDWEWGVTLWAKNPAYLKDIVYQMRFDKASALYAEFGPFYTSYIMSAEDILKNCLILP